MDMDSWITGSLDTVKYGLLLIALHRLDLASLASFPTTHHVLTLSIHVVKMNPSEKNHLAFIADFIRCYGILLPRMHHDNCQVIVPIDIVNGNRPYC
jgi:hypothetical protein